MLEKPYKAPKILGKLGNGKAFSRKDLAGEWLVLYFYPKDMTSGCTVEANDFQAALSKFEKLGCSVIGVSKDSCERHVKFSQKEGLEFALVSDEDGSLCEDYGVWKEKSLYGRKFMGIERSTFLIDPNSKVVAEWRKVKVAGHVADVLATLKACQKART